MSKSYALTLSLSIVLVVLICTRSALADPVRLYGFATYAKASANALGSSLDGCVQDMMPGRANASCTAGATAVHEDSDNSRSGSADAEATAHADIGTLGAYATASANTSGGYDITASGASSGASAYFYDTIRVWSETPLTGILSLQFDLALNGSDSRSLTESAYANTHERVTFGKDMPGGAYTLASFEQANGELYASWGDYPHPNIPFRATSSALGYSADVTFWLQLDVSADCGAGYSGGEDSCGSVAAYGDTLRVTGFQVLDSNHNPITDLSVTADSGFDYNGHGGIPPEVPEPGTLILFATGIGVIGTAVKHR